MNFVILIVFLPVFKETVEIEECGHRENKQRTQRGRETHCVRPEVRKKHCLSQSKQTHWNAMQCNPMHCLRPKFHKKRKENKVHCLSLKNKLAH